MGYPKVMNSPASQQFKVSTWGLKKTKKTRIKPGCATKQLQTGISGEVISHREAATAGTPSLYSSWGWLSLEALEPQPTKYRRQSLILARGGLLQVALTIFILPSPGTPNNFYISKNIYLSKIISGKYRIILEYYRILYPLFRSVGLFSYPHEVMKLKKIRAVVLLNQNFGAGWSASRSCQPMILNTCGSLPKALDLEAPPFQNFWSLELGRLHIQNSALILDQQMNSREI